MFTLGCGPTFVPTRSFEPKPGSSDHPDAARKTQEWKFHRKIIFAAMTTC